jgi:hypothetical protein
MEEKQMSEEDLTPDELEELRQALGENAPQRAEGAGIYNFFNKVLERQDSIKVSNLDEKETPSVRVLRSTSNYADIMGLKLISEYLDKEAEVVLGSALSKSGFLINAAITTKKESKLRTKSGEAKKGWNLFGKKDQAVED